MNKTFIVLPAHNEAPVITAVVQDVYQHGFTSIIVVDDGSTDRTAELATQAGAYVLSHRINRGKGAATKTGIEAAKLLNANIIVTMDADGQHQADDIARLIRPLIDNQCEVSLGTRRWQDSNIPRQKVLLNKIGNTATWLLHRQWVTDSQSGFRAYSRRAAELINTQADFYNYESEVIQQIRHHRLSYVEVPISARYTAYSRRKATRQSLGNGVKTLGRMLWQSIS